MLTYSEGKVCDAMIRLLEIREGASRTDLRSPEDEHHSAPVELVCRIGSKLFAFEHTGIEPFEGHMQLEAEAARHVEPIRTALAGVLPPGEAFELNIPAKAFQGRRKREIAEIQAAIIGWVKQTAPTLPVRRYADYIGDIAPVSPPAVPFDLRLYRFQSVTTPGHFIIKHILAGDLKQARAERLRVACDKKFPKLAHWKHAEGARTVLLLEDNDIQLTNQAVVAEAFLPLALARADRPDETYVVATCMEPWYVWPILIDGASYFDLAVRGRGQGWEIAPSLLTALTAR